MTTAKRVAALDPIPSVRPCFTQPRCVVLLGTALAASAPLGGSNASLELRHFYFNRDLRHAGAG